ncbi:MAG: hypothetical protein LC656_09635 [Sphingomonadales bacterium]|nr:hypothetical protein [Sphingomonadales bacterium]
MTLRIGSPSEISLEQREAQPIGLVNPKVNSKLAGKGWSGLRRLGDTREKSTHVA